MSNHTIPHKFTAALHAWLCISIALGLALASQAPAATECQRQRPLPVDVVLVTPGPQVPEAVARFAGVWIGEWERTDGFCHTLIIEEVFANGFARVLHSHGASLALNVLRGRIQVAELLQIHPGTDGPAATGRRLFL